MMDSWRHYPVRAFRFCCRRQMPPIRYLFSDAMETLSAMESTPRIPVARRSSVSMAMPFLMASCGWLTWLAPSGDGARCVAAQTEQALHQLGALGTDQTRNAEDLALADVEVDVTEALGVDGREVLDLAKHDLTGRIRARRVEVRQFTSDHLGDDHIGCQFLGLPGADVLAVAHDRDFVADAKNFVHCG